jgi:carbamoyltransferase
MLLGINANNHDASITLADNSNIRFAAHAERYSRIKNDKDLNVDLIGDCYCYGTPTEIVWSERPLLKATRKLYSGERPIYTHPKTYLKKYNLDHLKITTVPHHGAHAALGYYTSGFTNATIIVIDAIGEWDTISIWNDMRCIWRKLYPDSIGLFYTAMTDAIELKPNEEEYILMGMAAYGEPIHTHTLKNMLFEEWNPPHFKVKHNMHRGIRWLLEQHRDWRYVDIAASTQSIYEEYLVGIIKYAAKHATSSNLVLSGGCALNCVANNLVHYGKFFKNVYVPPNPGDAGLSLGAVLYKTRKHIKLNHAYLGYDIKNDINVGEVVDCLCRGEIVGIANGRAEYGPRALGNRSLLADPRGPDIKDRVNSIKQRQKFRPFAPVILTEHAREHFNIDHDNYDYMQYAVKCKKPNEFPAICHVDGTSRVQTVDASNPSIILNILKEWYRRTGCPMLLNTSLNIRGEPLVNDYRDAMNFSNLHNIRVF